MKSNGNNNLSQKNRIILAFTFVAVLNKVLRELAQIFADIGKRIRTSETRNGITFRSAAQPVPALAMFR